MKVFKSFSKLLTLNSQLYCSKVYNKLMAEDVVTIDDLIKKVLSYNPDADVELLKRHISFPVRLTAIRHG